MSNEARYWTAITILVIIVATVLLITKWMSQHKQDDPPLPAIASKRRTRKEESVYDWRQDQEFLSDLRNMQEAERKQKDRVYQAIQSYRSQEIDH